MAFLWEKRFCPQAVSFKEIPFLSLTRSKSSPPKTVFNLRFRRSDRWQVAGPGVGSNQPVLAGSLPHCEIFTVVLSRCAVILRYAHMIRSHIPSDIAALFDVGDVECEVGDTVAAWYPQILSNGIPPVHSLVMRRKIDCVWSVGGN